MEQCTVLKETKLTVISGSNYNLGSDLEPKLENFVPLMKKFWCLC
jgi:hypothetical protein